MVYASPIPQNLATGAYYDRIGKPFYCSPDKLESDYAPVRFERELRIFRQFCPSGNVLDVGCSTGAFLYQVKTRWPLNYRVLGADVASAALDYAEQKGVPVVRASFLEHYFQGHHFDVITFWAVMEHLAEPEKFLAKAADLLNPGGHLFILVPNWRSLAIRILGRRYRYIYADHVNYFSRNTLARFACASSRFDVAGHGSTHFNPLVLAQDLFKRVDRVPDEDRAKLLKKTTGYKQNPWLRPLKWAYHLTETVLGGCNLADNIYIVLQKRKKELSTSVA
jgi:2-polyprenyl-3-methyl-5-hydroxy-6-metoxy-1,4-benzoquinol methylase